MARQLKAEAPKIPIIVGGAFATLNADRILMDCADIDCVGCGEGEELLPDYLDHLDDPGAVAGLVWREGAESCCRIRRAPFWRTWTSSLIPTAPACRLTTSSPCRWMCPAVLSLDKFCTVQTSRGCPYSCIYCDIPSLGEGRWRCRSPEHVLGELQQLNDQGYRSLYLTDDHFLINRKRISGICQGIIERKLQFNWGCEGRVDAVGMDQLPIMKQARCNFLAFGVEAGTQKVLDRLKKKQTPAQVEQRGQRSQAARHRPGARVLCGRLARRNRSGHQGELPLRRAARAGHLWVQSPCAPTGARRSGRSTWTAGSLTTSGIGTNGSSARTLTRPPCRARKSIACGRRDMAPSLPGGFCSVRSERRSCSAPLAAT